jgi:hypothetical protein
LEAIPDDFIAAALDYEFDYPRMAREVLACEEYFVPTPPYQRQVDGALSGEIPFMSESKARYRAIDTMVDDAVCRKALRGVNIFYLRNSRESDVTRDSRFSTTKKLRHDSWFWRPELEARIPYTVSCIESLPYRTLGLIRVFVCQDTFMPTHRDTVPVRGYDKSKAIGLSLIPATGGVGMLIWDERRREVREMDGHCLLFDDSKWHGVPMTEGTRITLRIFGELDFARLGARFAGAAALA